MIRVLTFDLAKCVGWAIGEAQKPPRCGSHHLSKLPIGDDLGALYSSQRRFMLDMIGVHQPTHLGIEAALAVAGRSAVTQRLLFGLCAHAEQIADETGLPCFDMNVNTVRAYVVGHGHCGKPGVLVHCIAQGWAFPDDNAADACVLADYLLSSLGAGRLATGRPAMEAIPGW